MRTSGDWREIDPGPLVKVMLPEADCWERNVRDGYLTVLVGREDGEWHLSISHTKITRSGRIPGRNPRWEEITDARYRFTPDDVYMAMILPPKDEYVNVHETTFHLWEIDVNNVGGLGSSGREL